MVYFRWRLSSRNRTINSRPFGEFGWLFHAAVCHRALAEDLRAENSPLTTSGSAPGSPEQVWASAHRPPAKSGATRMRAFWGRGRGGPGAGRGRGGRGLGDARGLWGLCGRRCAASCRAAAGFPDPAGRFLPPRTLGHERKYRLLYF